MMFHRLASIVILLAVLGGTTPGAAQTSDATSTGVSRAFNPAISLNGLFLATFDDAATHEVSTDAHDGHDGHEEFAEGLGLQESELRLSAAIDAYSTADATFAYHGGEIGLEEIFVDSHALPRGFGLRAGLFYVPISRENTTHTHQLPFVTRSMVQEELFGEGWAEAGALLSWLAPTDTYAELRVGVFDGHEETWFGAEEGEDLAYHFGLASLFELNATTTLEFDAAGVLGRHGHGDDAFTKIGNVGTRLVWKPRKGSERKAVRFAMEYTAADRPSVDEGDLRQSGTTASLQARWSRRFWTSLGFESWNPRGGDVSGRWRAGIAFVPTEFQSLRLELTRTDDEDDSINGISLQYNFTIGSHPAHRY